MSLLTSAAAKGISKEPNEAVRVAREQVELAVIVPIHGADAILADRVARLELFREWRPARSTSETRRLRALPFGVAFEAMG